MLLISNAFIYYIKFKPKKTQTSSLVVRLEVSFEDFLKLDIRVGKIVKAEQIPGSRNLIKMMVDFGSEKRQSVAGLLQHYKPEELVDKQYAFVLNLQRRKLMGVESQCMILAAEDTKGKVILIKPERDIEKGSKIR